MAIWYPKNVEERSLDEMSTVAIQEEIQSSVVETSRKRGRPRKNGESQLNSNQETHEVRKEKKVTETKKVQRTVFDLQEFDNILLVKEITLPGRPESLENALEIVNHDKEKLLELIHQGLMAEAKDKAWEDITGFKVADEKGDPGEDYTGKFADEEKGKLINAAILSLAKMQGYDKSLAKEKKRELKDKAAEFLRSNPAMLQSIQG